MATKNDKPKKATKKKPYELKCPYCGGTTISTDSEGHCCMECYGMF